MSFTYSSLKIGNSELFAFIASQIVRRIESKSAGRTIRTKDLARLVWSFALLQEPLHNVVHRTLVKNLQLDLQLAHLYPEVFVEAMVGLVMNQVYPVELLQLLFSSEFLSRKSERSLEQTFQLLLLDTATKIECKDSFNVQSMQVTKFCSTESVGNLKFQLCTRQGLLSLVNSLHHLLPDPTCVRCHFILPHSRITDIEIRLDKTGRPVAFNSDMSDVAVLRNISPSDLRVTVGGVNNGQTPASVQMGSIMQQLLEQSVGSDSARTDPGHIHLQPFTNIFGSERRITIKVMGWNQYLMNKPLLLGLHQMELRLLQRLGYEVLVVSPFQAQRLDRMSNVERIGFVTQLLSDRLSIKLSAAE
jgi:hypothetical protein